MTYFIAELTYEESLVLVLHQGSGAGLVLITLEANELEIALKFLFKASNNESEYEAILEGLRIAGDYGGKENSSLQ